MHGDCSTIRVGVGGRDCPGRMHWAWIVKAQPTKSIDVKGIELIATVSSMASAPQNEAIALRVVNATIPVIDDRTNTLSTGIRAVPQGARINTPQL